MKNLLTDTISLMTKGIGVSNDTLYVQLIQSDIPNDNFTMNSPIWYILGTLIISITGFIIAVKLKNKEASIELKKVLLLRRLEAHQKLLEMITSAKVLKGDDVVFNRTFESVEILHKWFDEFIVIANANNSYLTYDLKKQINFLSNFRKNLYNIIKSKNMDSLQLQAFAAKYRSEISDIFRETEDIIVRFFEKGNIMKYKFKRMTKNDYKKVIKKLESNKILCENQ